MTYSKILLGATALLVASTASAVNVTFQAATSSSIATSAGSDLAPGSLVLFGTFDISATEISANALNIDFLTEHFTQLGSSYIGQGQPAGGTGESDLVNSGLFIGGNATLNSGAMGVAGMTAYIWVFDSVTAAESNEHGIFSSDLASWTIPAGDGTPLDFSQMAIDVADLTASAAGLVLDSSAKIVVGSFNGESLNAFGAGRFQLAAIPEASTYAVIAGIFAIGAAVYRRRSIR